MVLCLPFPLPDVIDEPCQTQLKEIFSRVLDWTFGWPINLVLLPSNVETLHREMTSLQMTAEDVDRRLQTAVSQPGKEPRLLVKGWLEDVNNLGAAVDGFQKAYGTRQSILITGFCLGNSAAQLLRRVRDLNSRASNFTQPEDLVTDAPPAFDNLVKEMEQLKTIRDDLLREVEVRERSDPLLKRTSQVKRWLEDADAVLNTQMAAGLDIDLLRRVRNLKNERDLITGDVVTQVLPAAVGAVPSSSSISSLVCRVGTLMEIDFYLHIESIKIVGICGPGGVGKTALMKIINNEIEKASRDNRVPFDVVILITVSRNMNELQIQSDIGKRVGLSLIEDGPSDGDQRDRLIDQQAKDVFRVLSKKRFLLLLDDIWTELDLEKVGIPHPDADEYYDQCKIVFATRDEAVCNDMLSLCGNEAARAKVTVPFLCESHARELFWRACGNRNEVLAADPRIQLLAEKVIQQCGGLPLALLTMGKAMARKKQHQLWEDAVWKLEHSPEEIRGMETKVLRILRFSYDELKEQSIRQCLLYCSLFPESQDIDRKQLVEYWIGDGLLDAQDDGDHTISAVRNKGHDYIYILQSAHLLECGVVDEVNKVRLHDVVRALALWLTSGGAGAEATRFINLAGRGIDEVRSTGTWAEATRISLMRNKLRRLPDDIPRCPMLTTLLAGDHDIDPDSVPGEWEERTYDPPPAHPSTSDVNSVKGVLLPPRTHKFFSIPPAFFQFTGALRVLDLSKALIVDIPSTIGLLAELQFLKLFDTKIRRLPKELGKLTKLRQLDLSCTDLLEEIPQESISTLRMLQVFNVYDSRYEWPCGLYGAGHAQGTQANLRCIEGLPHLDELGLCLRTLLSLRRITTSNRLSNLVRFLKVSVKHLTSSDLSEALESLTGMQELYLADCPQLERLEFPNGQPQSLEVLQLCSLTSLSRVGRSGLSPLGNLRRLYILGCPSLNDVSWLGTLPSLQEMHLYVCEQIEELLPPTVPHGDGAFPMLRELHLMDLPRLRCICRHPLHFASLQMIEVHRCPELRKLSLLPRGGMKIYQIRGAQDWWDALEWETEEDGNSAKAGLSGRFTSTGQTFIPGAKVMMWIKDGGRELTLFPKLQ